jgi:hypothetical protein
MRARLRRAQFPIAYLLLGLVAGGLGLLTPLALSLEKPPRAERPSLRVDGLTAKQKMKQIGDYTAKRYHLNGAGDRLVDVIGSQGEVAGQSFKSVLFLKDATSPPEKVVADKVATYVLCGDGEGCVIPGESTEERGCLLFHEAFELAYHSFAHLEEVDFVVVILPVDYDSGKVSLVFKRESFSALSQQKLPKAMGFDDPPLSGKGACTFSPGEKSAQTVAVTGLSASDGETSLAVIYATNDESAQLGGEEK